MSLVSVNPAILAVSSSDSSTFLAARSLFALCREQLESTPKQDNLQDGGSEEHVLIHRMIHVDQ